MALFSPAHASATLKPTEPRSRNSPMQTLSSPGTPRDYMRSTGSSGSPRMSYTEQWGGSMASMDPFTRAATGALSATSYSSQLENASLYSRRQEWNQTSHLNTRHKPAWERYGREDLLNVNLELHPFWVAKSPGTYDSTFERWNLWTAPSSPSSPRSRVGSPTGWDSRFISAHTLDGNPVYNGMRTLSPARRRHNGGVGAEGLV